MASKKSKILAMALCASVMTGIYASPVMAAGQISGINVTGVPGTGLDAQDSVFINGVELAIQPGGMTGIVNADGGKFTQLTVTNGMGITGVLTVGGTSIDSTDGDTLVGGTLTAAGAANLNGGLTVSGGATVNDGLTVNDTATVNGMLTASDGLKVTNDGIEVEEGGLTVVQGNTDIQDGLTVSNGATISEGLTVTGETTVDSLKSNGNAEVGGTLEVTDKLTANNGLKVTNGTETDTLKVTGDTTLANATVGGTLNVTDKLTANNGLKVTNGTETDTLTVTGAAKVNSLEVASGIKAANGTFQLTDAGVLTVGGKAAFTQGVTVQNGLSVAGDSSVAGNFAVINGDLSVTKGGLTVNNGDTTLNGKLDVGAGNFKVDTNGNTRFNGNLNINHGNFTVKAATGNTVVKGTLKLGSLEGREVGQAIKDLEAYAGDLKGANLPDKVGGIERNPESAGAASGDGTTTIENGAEFTETAMTMGDTIVESGKITVGAEDDQTIIDGGAITAKSLLLDGKNVGETIFGIKRVGDVTTIEGATSFDANGMSIKDVEGFGTSLGVAGMDITATGGLKTSFTAGGATFVGASGTTTINGGEIQTTTINGVNFSEWHDKVDGRLDKLEYKTQNIKPGTGAGTGTGEGGTSGLTDGEDTITVPDTAPGHTGITGNVTVEGEINAGEIVVGDKGSDNKTTIDGGNVTVNGGENGSTTINGGNITTGDTTIDGEGINTGKGNFAGDVDVDGKVTVGDGTTITGEGITTGTGTFDDVIIGEKTTIDSNGINTNDITAGTGTIGNVDMDKTGITVGGGTAITKDTVTTVNIKADDGEFDSQVTVGGNTTITDGKINLGGDNGTNINADGMTVGTGENATSITNDTVKAQNGDFDNLTAGSGTFGTGNNKTVINNDGVTVGGENGSSITGEGITVGDKNGVSIKNDEVRVGGGEDGKGGSYMNDTDVVTGEGVSLNQTAERVGHLENRVGKLEDRIDKVGAMAAAIANLRTMGYDPAAPTEVAVGIGQYRDETGAALGLFHYPNRDFMLSLSVSTSGDEVMGGIGATWKFGRKSPEKVAEIKKAQAEADARRAEEAKLAKAEEMKQAAKEAKIKAQQERHAKLAAERAAQAEAAK